MQYWRRDDVDIATNSINSWFSVRFDLIEKFISDNYVLPSMKSAENQEKSIINTQIKARKNHSMCIHAFTVKAKILKKKGFFLRKIQFQVKKSLHICYKFEKCVWEHS